MKVITLANEIFLDNGEPKDTGLASISQWIRSSIGKLNLLIYEDFYVDYNGDYEIKKHTCGHFNHLATEIVKQMFTVYKLNLDIRKNLLALTFDTVISAEDQEYKITRVNKSEVLKTLNSLKQNAILELRELVTYYRSTYSSPDSISGNDYICQVYNSIENDAFVRNIPGPP